MSIYETIGVAWVILSAVCFHVAVIVLAYRQVKALLAAAQEHVMYHDGLAARGYQEQMMDIRTAAQVRFQVESGQ